MLRLSSRLEKASTQTLKIAEINAYIVFDYRIPSIKRRGALKIFEVLGAALFRGRCLLEGGALFKFLISHLDSRNQETTHEIDNCHFDF